jgi:2'-5' RNA ligase
MKYTSALIVGVPAADDPINELSTEDRAHITMLFFGEHADMPPEIADELRLVVPAIADEFGAFEVDVAGVAIIGPDKASVLIVESGELVDLRNELAMEPCVQAALALPERQFPNWLPHVTLNYGGGVEPEPPATIRIDALGLWLGDDKTDHRLGSDAAVLAGALSIPVINDAADLSVGIQYADANPDARWYVRKRASAFRAQDMIPAQWGFA